MSPFPFFLWSGCCEASFSTFWKTMCHSKHTKSSTPLFGQSIPLHLAVKIAPCRLACQVFDLKASWWEQGNCYASTWLGSAGGHAFFNASSWPCRKSIWEGHPSSLHVEHRRRNKILWFWYCLAERLGTCEFFQLYFMHGTVVYKFFLSVNSVR